MSLPGSFRDALVAADDRVPGDRSQFLLELIRRTYNTPLAVKNFRRDAVLQSTLAVLDPSKASAAGSDSAVTLPLPLPQQLWIDVVFGGRATAASLARDILQSRGASLLYYGSLSLDDPTRAWLSTERDLVATLTTQHPASFAAAAPALRVADGRVRVPGGEAANAVWEALVGARVTEPTAFVRALVMANEGRLAYWFGATAALTTGQIQTLLDLDASESSARVAAARRLHVVFERVTAGWRVEERAFWRPSVDPILLVADLPTDDRGRPIIPGTRKFWNAVFEPGEQLSRADNGSQDATRGEPLNFASLCEEVFSGDRPADRDRYQLVMFMTRVIKTLTPDAIAIGTRGAYLPRAHRHARTRRSRGRRRLRGGRAAGRRTGSGCRRRPRHAGNRAISGRGRAVGRRRHTRWSGTGGAGSTRDVALGAGDHESRRLRREAGGLAG